MTDPIFYLVNTVNSLKDRVDYLERLPTLSKLAGITLISGGVIFTASGGSLTSNSTGFFWDNTNLRLGIGTNSPTSTLQVSGAILGRSLNIQNGTGSSTIEVGANGSGSRYAHVDLVGDDTYTDYGLRVIRNNGGANTGSEILHRGTGQLNVATVDAAPIVFYTNSNSRMTISSVGDIGIGVTASVGVRLTTQGAGTTSTTYSLSTKNSAGTNMMYIRDDGQCWANVAWTIGSDRRLKKHIVDLDGSGVGIAKALRGVRYHLVTDEEQKLHTGFIAQEVAKVLPHLVTETEDGMLSLAYEELHPYWAKAIVELSEDVAALKEEVRELRREINRTK